MPVRKKRDFDPKRFLATSGEGRKVVVFNEKRFRKLGFVDYGGSGMKVHGSRLNIILHD